MGFREDFSGTALRGDWLQGIRPTDNPNTLLVSSSTAALASGVTPGQTRFISLGLGGQRQSIVLDFTMLISARVADQAWFVGFFNDQDPRNATAFVRWRFDGAGAATSAFCEVQAAPGSAEGIAVAAVVSGTGTNAAYRIDWNNTRVEFYEGGTAFPPTTLRATRTIHLPSPDRSYWLAMGVTNASGAAPASSTTMTTDVFEFTDSI